jgi:hypothetical protein
MADTSETQNAEPNSVGSELIIPISAVVFTLYYFYTIVDAPWTAQVAAFIVGSILILLVVWFFVRSIRSLKTGQGVLNFSSLVRPTSLVPKRAVLLVITIAYIFTVPILGFTITTFLFLGSAMLVLNDFEKKGFITVLAIFLSVGGYLLFVVAFETRFPEGPFEKIMKGLF